jgi:U4/U6.U5 tri-snRNP-associated protein 2
LYAQRFVKNSFFVEKNPTIVNFPVKNLELRDYVDAAAELPAGATKYDLVANIVHDSPPHKTRGDGMDAYEGGTYRCHVLNDVRERASAGVPARLHARC